MRERPQVRCTGCAAILAGDAAERRPALCDDCAEAETNEACGRQVEDLLAGYKLDRVLKCISTELEGWASKARNDGEPDSAQWADELAEMLYAAAELAEGPRPTPRPGQRQ